MKTELVNLEKMELQPAALFQPGGLEELLARIESEARALVPDVSTGVGRKAIASNAARIPRSKTYLDDLGKKLTANLKKQTKAVDVERKNMRDRLDALKAEVRAPLTEWEEAEKARVAGLQNSIESMRGLAHSNDEGQMYSAAQLVDQLDTLRAIPIDDSWQEFAPEAARAKDEGISTLEQLISERQAHEKEQAELAQLRKEAEERARREREERIRQEAAAKAEQEAECRAKREAERVERQRQAEAQEQERERLAAVEREQAAERRALAAEKHAEQQAEDAARRERERIEANRRNEEEAARKRAADMANRNRIEDAAVNAMMTFGLSDAQARTVVVAIRLGQIPNVRITY